jgi:hypothetical protein
VDLSGRLSAAIAAGSPGGGREAEAPERRVSQKLARLEGKDFAPVAERAFQAIGKPAAGKL